MPGRMYHLARDRNIGFGYIKKEHQVTWSTGVRLLSTVFSVYDGSWGKCRAAPTVFLCKISAGWAVEGLQAPHISSGAQTTVIGA